MPLKILFADDSMTAQNMGTKILTEAGYEVVAVSNGSAALKKIAEHKPDLVILDVYMPGYSGLEVCEKLRNSIDTLNTPVLLTVGKMEPYRREDANRVKADGIIIKPFEATDLIAIIKQLEERIVPVTSPAAAERTMYLERPTTLTDEYRQEEFAVESATVDGSSITHHPPLPKTQAAIEVPDYMASSSAFSDLLHTAPSAVEERAAATPAPPAAEAPAHAQVEAVQQEPAVAEEAPTPFHVAPAQWNWEPAPGIAEYANNSSASAVEEPEPQRTQKIPRYEEPEVAAAPPARVEAAPEEVAVPLHPVESNAASVSIPNMLMGHSIESEPAAAAHHSSIPAVDPALVTDRTEMASSFATRFGTKEVEPVSDAAQPEATAAEVEPAIAAYEAKLDQAAGAEAAVSTDDFEARVAAAMSAYEHHEVVADEPEAIAELEAVEAEAHTAEPVSEPGLPEAVTGDAVVASFVHETAPAVEEHVPSVTEATESAIHHYTHEIAANVTSELPAATAASSAVAASPEVISQIVHRVLDRLKPHLVEEIIRELTSGKTE